VFGPAHGEKVTKEVGGRAIKGRNKWEEVILQNFEKT